MTFQEAIQLQKEQYPARVKQTQKEVQEFNMRRNWAVAVDCSSFCGDDNDLSCKLSRMQERMFAAGLVDDAYLLWQIDSMCGELSKDEYIEMMTERQKLK